MTRTGTLWVVYRVPYVIDRKKLATMGGRSLPRFNGWLVHASSLIRCSFAMFLKREDGD
jgi:hypothetical protein